ncbi:MAG: hypothetical protein JWM60_1268 [Solirubrobacterales bacterium]|jgi:hypothetical protein|nr:hypothetical protein [Solirubrobacterales bacterium]
MMRLRLAVSSLAAASLLALCAAASTAGAPATRDAKLTLNPAPGDVELAELEFPRQRRQSITPSTLAVAAHGIFGHDYLAVATPRRRPHGELVALVLLVNRRTAPAGPASVRISVRSRRSLGSFVAVKLRDPLAARPSGTLVKLGSRSELPCAIPRASSVLHASDLRQVGRARGAALAGYTPTGALAAAFDAACTAVDSSAFRQAVQGPGAPAPGPAPAPPPPVPVPGPPRCSPCSPRPGVACPLVAAEAVCVAGKDEAARSMAAGAH